MSGWKGIAGGVGLIVYALSGILIKMVLPESDYGMGLVDAIPVFLAGLGIFGIRLKLNK